MTTRPSASRNASARIEALETRSLMSGELDRSFMGYGGGQSLDVRAVAVQSNNYTVLAAVEPGTNQLRVSRLTTSGGRDGAFGNKGNVVIPAVRADRVDSITVLANGKILVGGTQYVRLNANGTIDTTYGGGDGIAPSKLAPDRRANQATYVYPNGSIVELGDRSPTGANYVFKYKADGSIDTSFASKGAFNVGAFGIQRTGAVSVDTSGRIYVTFENNAYQLSVVRLTAAGKIDKTWGTNGVATGSEGTISSINAMAVLNDGRVIVGWDFSTSSDYYGYDVFSSAGKLINTPLNQLGINGTSFFAADSITQAKDGSVYIGGSYYAINGGGHDDPDNAVPVGGTSAVVHLKSDLTLDKNYSANRDGIGGFGLQGVGLHYVASAVASNGSVVLVGRSYSGTSGIARLTGNGVANRVSATVSASAVVVTGSDQADYFSFDEVYDDRDGAYDRVIYLDAPISNGIRSADVLLFDALSPDQKFTINARGGNDRIKAGEANYTLYLNGGGGDDYIEGSRGRNVINGDDGNDSLYAYDSNASTIHGNAGDDTIGVGNRGIAYGDGGNDTVSGLHYATLYGGDGNDRLGHATSQGYPGLLDGGAGDDTAFYISGDVLKSIEHANFVP